jgi:hypothetical protein
VITQVYDKDENPLHASAPVELARQLEDNITDVEKVFRIHSSLYGDAIYGEKKIRLSGYFTDPAFFEIFNFPFLEGNKITSLTNPTTIVISQREAIKIFGSKDAMGEMIKLKGMEIS